jgi:hypothetical protein
MRAPQPFSLAKLFPTPGPVCGPSVAVAVAVKHIPIGFHHPSEENTHSQGAATALTYCMNLDTKETLELPCAEMGRAVLALMHQLAILVPLLICSPTDHYAEKNDNGANPPGALFDNSSTSVTWTVPDRLRWGLCRFSRGRVCLERQIGRVITANKSCI